MYIIWLYSRLFHCTSRFFLLVLRTYKESGGRVGLNGDPGAGGFLLHFLNRSKDLNKIGAFFVTLICPLAVFIRRSAPICIIRYCPGFYKVSQLLATTCQTFVPHFIPHVHRCHKCHTVRYNKNWPGGVFTCIQLFWFNKRFSPSFDVPLCQFSA